MTDNNIRYDRQKRVPNWEQEKLSGAKVAIVGTGQLAQFTAASLVSLGIGEIEIYDDGKLDGGFLISSQGESRVGDLERRLREMNPSSNVRGVRMYESEISFNNGINLVLDLTNSPELKERVLKYSSSKSIPVISASTGNTGGELYFVR